MNARLEFDAMKRALLLLSACFALLQPLASGAQGGLEAFLPSSDVVASEHGLEFDEHGSEFGRLDETTQDVRQRIEALGLAQDVSESRAEYEAWLRQQQFVEPATGAVRVYSTDSIYMEPVATVAASGVSSPEPENPFGFSNPSDNPFAAALRAVESSDPTHSLRRPDREEFINQLYGQGGTLKDLTIDR